MKTSSNTNDLKSENAKCVNLYNITNENQKPELWTSFDKIDDGENWIRKALNGTGALNIMSIKVLNASERWGLYLSMNTGLYVLFFLTEPGQDPDEVADTLRHHIDDARKWRMTMRICDDITTAITSAPAAAYVMKSRSIQNREIMVSRDEEFDNRCHVVWTTGDTITRDIVNLSQREAAAYVLAFFDDEDGERCAATGTPIYSVSQISETDVPAMRQYDIDVHFDASITMHGIIAESEQEAREIARQRAKEMNLFCAAMVATDAGEEVAHCHVMTDEEISEEEREKVQELVPWLLEQVTPTEWHDYAEGCPFGWTDYEAEDTSEWERRLFEAIADGFTPDTALYNRYARMYARKKWEEHADELRQQWDEAWQQARRNPETYRVIVETNEEDPSAAGNEFGRYYMIDGSESESSIEHAGQWVVIRVDTVTSPYEVHRPNFAAAHGYSDDQTQLACRCENPNNVTRWARKMIDAGRVTDIYADCY